jgi:hypothetical protein
MLMIQDIMAGSLSARPALAPRGDLNPKHPHEVELERAASSIMQALQQHKWDDPALKHYLAPGVITHWDEFPPTHTREEFVDRCKEMYMNSNYTIEQINQTCHLYDNGKKAVQWFTSVTRNLPITHQTSMYRETVVRLNWEKVAGSWLCVRNHHSRGSGLSFG